MSTTSKPQDRLEALLTGLEDEVIRMDDRAALSPDEDGATTDIGELRLSMESVIASAMDVTERQRESSQHTRKGQEGRVGRALEFLGRWGGVKKRESRPTGVPQVRMAFSGKQEPTGEQAANRRSRRRHRGSESKDKEG